MKFFAVPNAGGTAERIIYGVTADTVFVGTAAPAGEVGHYPIIEIYYPEEHNPTILKLLGEMDRQNVSPEVSIVSHPGMVDVVVLFRIPMAGETARDILHYPPEVKVAPKVLVYLTGETDYDQVDGFLGLHRDLGYFYVAVSRKLTDSRGELAGGDPLWSKKLFAYSRTPPKP